VHEQHLGGERAVEEAAGDRVDGYPRAGQLHAVGDQAVHGHRDGERDRANPVTRCAIGTGRGGLAAAVSLR
jgi:hypothetical protein